MTTRRGFLTGILALGAAPAIVRAESLMRLWVPPQELFGYDLSNGLDKSCIVKARRHMDGTIEITDQYVFIMHPSAEEAMREIVIYGGATIVCRPEVVRHG